MEIEDKNCLTVEDASGNIFSIHLDLYLDKPQRYESYFILNGEKFPLRKFQFKKNAVDFWRYINLIYKKKDTE